MGKATIVSGGEKGNYTVKLDFGQAVKHQRLQGFDDLRAQLAPLITDAQTKLTQQESAESAKRSAVTAATDAYTTAAQADPPDPAAMKKALDAFTAALATLNSERARTSQLRLSLQVLKDEKAQIDKDYAKWSAMELEVTQQAWCADYTEDATGNVNTIEISGESKLILIDPGAPAYAAGTGALVAREVQSPEQVFWNAAVLPGWQKWKPTYRVGKITAKNDDGTLNVELDPATSSAQNLDINRVQTLQKVPATYMTCDADAFEVDDKCVVRFEGRSWESPRVVGFADNPKPCSPFYVAWANAYDYGQGQLWAEVVLKDTDGIIADILANHTAYQFEFSLGGGWYWPPIDASGVNRGLLNVGEWHGPGYYWDLPRLAFVNGINGYTVVTSMAQDRYGGAVLGFRIKKAGKVIGRWAVKNDGAAYTNTLFEVAGAAISKNLAGWSSPVKRFTYEFPE